MDLKKLSQEELNKLKQQIVYEERRRIEEEQTELLNRLDEINILKFIKHDRTSCNDENPCNGYSSSVGHARCNKCHLIEIMSEHKEGIHDFEIKLTLEINKIKE